MIYVLDKDNNPLMPCKRHGKVKHLLRQGKAKVICRCPFTIKLLYETTKFKQPLTLGIDTGSGTFGTAVYGKEIVYMSEVQVRNDITRKMEQKKMYRRTRRNRLRYRPARWLNRKNSIKKDRFSPTMASKFNGHFKEIEFIKSILPISRIVIEAGKFDTHLMKNPSLANEKVKHWGYQKGPNYGFANTKAMILARDNHTCQICKKKHGKLHVHHIEYRSNGGSNDPSNLITVCEDCHKKIHSNEINPRLKGKVKDRLVYATQMNNIRVQLFKKYPEAIETFGMITKENRQLLELEKTHYHDACTIASGGNPFKINCNIFMKKCIPQGDSRLTKGERGEIKLPTGKLHGFRKFDKVIYFGKEYFIKGRGSNGYACLMDIKGEKQDFSHLGKGMKTPKLSLCKRVSARKSVMIKEIKYGKTC